MALAVPRYFFSSRRPLSCENVLSPLTFSLNYCPLFTRQGPEECSSLFALPFLPDWCCPQRIWGLTPESPASGILRQPAQNWRHPFRGWAWDNARGEGLGTALHGSLRGKDNGSLKAGGGGRRFPFSHMLVSQDLPCIYLCRWKAVLPPTNKNSFLSLVNPICAIVRRVCSLIETMAAKRGGLPEAS